jgi:hypothetical protein
MNAYPTQKDFYVLRTKTDQKRNNNENSESEFTKRIEFPVYSTSMCLMYNATEGKTGEYIRKVVATIISGKLHGWMHDAKHVEVHQIGNEPRSVSSVDWRYPFLSRNRQTYRVIRAGKLGGLCTAPDSSM